MAGMAVIFFEIGMLIFCGIIRLVLLLLRRFDVTNSLLAGIIVLMLVQGTTLDRGWRVGLVLGVMGGSFLIQHYSKIGRAVFGIMSCIVVACLGGCWKHYDSQKVQYGVMAICFVVTAALNLLSCAQSNEGATKMAIE